MIFVVAVKENDTDDPEGSRGIVKGKVAGSVFGSLPFSRAEKVTKLINDVRSALRTPSPNGINFDETVGDPQELRFSREELARAESGQVVSKSLVFSGDGGQYTLTFEARNPYWQGFELAPSATVSTSGGIGVVSRIPGHMEVFAIGANGSVQDNFWYDDGQNWRGFELAGLGSASSSAGLAVVSRIPGHMEVFFVGSNGFVQDKFWYDDGQGWRGFELAPPGSASPTGGITAVSRIPGHMEVFFVGSNGSVQDKFWYDDGQHWRGFELQPAGSAPPTGKIAAVSRIPQSMELWYTGAAGQLRHNF